MILEHFKYPNVFLRRTKKAYISIVTNDILEIAARVDCCSYNSLNIYCKRNKLDVRMSYCRKIFATHLRTSGIEQETIDFLQGRVPRSVFARVSVFRMSRLTKIQRCCGEKQPAWRSNRC